MRSARQNNNRTLKISHIKAISFDGDMTLWDFNKVMRRSLEYALAELRIRAPGERSTGLTVDKMIGIRDATAAELRGKRYDLEGIRLCAFERVVEFVGSADAHLAEDLNSLYMQHRFEDIELYPDVIPVLDSLKPRYCLGLLSNGNSDPERCGLPDRFRFVTFAQEIGVEKPAPDIFLAACEQAGCNPEQLMHVGDSFETDVFGANGIGAISVWLNRDKKRNNTGIIPDYEIHTLAALKDILAVE